MLHSRRAEYGAADTRIAQHPRDRDFAAHPSVLQAQKFKMFRSLNLGAVIFPGANCIPGISKAAQLKPSLLKQATADRHAGESAETLGSHLVYNRATLRLQNAVVGHHDLEQRDRCDVLDRFDVSIVGTEMENLALFLEPYQRIQ